MEKLYKRIAKPEVGIGQRARDSVCLLPSSPAASESLSPPNPNLLGV